MSWQDLDGEDATTYKVVVNHEEQYSVWPEYKENPLGWMDVGKVGLKAECLAYIKEVWTDMRPLSLRKWMEETVKNPPAPSEPEPEESSEKSLVDRLCEGDHRVEVCLRPEKSVSHFKLALDRNYLNIKFTDTIGGTELGASLVREACDFSKGDFESGEGMVHTEGELTLDYVKVRCKCDIDLTTLEGKGYLVKLDRKQETDSPSSAFAH
jgi:uncharacterized protein YbdZ (MbtH family)